MKACMASVALLLSLIALTFVLFVPNDQGHYFAGREEGRRLLEDLTKLRIPSQSLSPPSQSKVRQDSVPDKDKQIAIAYPVGLRPKAYPYHRTIRREGIKASERAERIKPVYPGTEHSARSNPSTLHRSRSSRGEDRSKLTKARKYYLDATPDTTLQCVDNRGVSYNLSSSISVTVGQIADYGFQPDCPCPRDPTGQCRRKPHLCHSTQQSYFCTFHVKDVIVSKWGGLLETHSKRMISFDHPTVAGKHTPQYYPNVAAKFLKAFKGALDLYQPSLLPIRTVDVLVPLRTRWDDCFNHLSFQSMPLIGLVYEFHRDIFYVVHWHASRFTAALLMLLDVLPERIVVESDVQARQLLLPWTPYFNPIQLATIKGVALEASLRMTKKLLSLTFTAEQKAEVVRVVPLDYRYRPIPEETIQSWPETDRFVVYLNRSSTGTRTVANEAQLLSILEQNLQPHVHLIVLGPTREYKKIESMFLVWQSYARIVNRAIVLIGPHGGALGNMLWAPADCDLVEFNEFPDDDNFTVSHGGTPVRRPFLSAFYVRQHRHQKLLNPNETDVSSNINLHDTAVKDDSTSEYWNIAPTIKHPFDFYAGRMQMSLREVLRVFARIKQGSLLRHTTAWQSLSEETPSTWYVDEKDYLALSRKHASAQRAIDRLDNDPSGPTTRAPPSYQQQKPSDVHQRYGVQRRYKLEPETSSLESSKASHIQKPLEPPASSFTPPRIRGRVHQRHQQQQQESQLQQTYRAKVQSLYRAGGPSASSQTPQQSAGGLHGIQHPLRPQLNPDPQT